MYMNDSMHMYKNLHDINLTVCFLPIYIVNECEMNNGGCEQECVDLPRLFRCNCGPGFNLAANERSCDGKHVCFCYATHLCVLITTFSV